MSDTQILPTTAEFAELIIDNPRFIDFSEIISVNHGIIHQWFSGGNYKVALHGSWSADDPLFFVLHSYLDYFHNLWASCWNYDRPHTIDLKANHDIFQPFCDHMDCTRNPNCTTKTSSDSSSDEHSQRIGTATCGAIKWDDTFNYRPMNVQPWSLTSKMNIKLKDMYNINDWGIKYELGTFYEKSRINRFCERNHPDFLNHNTWFVTNDEEDDHYTQQSDTQTYIDKLWDDLDDKEYDDMDIKMKYKLVESLACKYNRRHNANSCWNEESFKDLEIETCSGRGMSGYEVSQLSLEEFLDFDGVRDNKCLRQIRENAYYLTDFFNDDMKLKICDGEWD
eukprot:27602_1